MCEILETEQLYEQLLDVLLRSDDKYLLHQYTDLLSEKYPEQLLQIYREIVEKQAESTGGQKAFLPNCRRVKNHEIYYRR